MSLITRAHDRWAVFHPADSVHRLVRGPARRQDDASDEFILFASDRAFPSQQVSAPVAKTST